MSEAPTPRTDDAAEMLPIYGSSDSEWVDAAFARQLERSLSAANLKWSAIDNELRQRDKDLLIALELERVLREELAVVKKAHAEALDEWARVQGELKAAQSASGALPAWLKDWTPDMRQAVEDYYANWQRVSGIHDPDKVKSDSWSAFQAWRAALNAVLSSTAKREGE